MQRVRCLIGVELSLAPIFDADLVCSGGKICSAPNQLSEPPSSSPSLFFQQGIFLHQTIKVPKAKSTFR